MINQSTEMTPRESLEHEWRVEEFEKTSEHAIKMKQLEIELAKEDHKAEIELKKLEAKWAAWLRLPRTILLLPVLILFAFAYIFAIGFNYQPPKRFWDLLS